MSQPVDRQGDGRLELVPDRDNLHIAPFPELVNSGWKTHVVIDAPPRLFAQKIMLQKGRVTINLIHIPLIVKNGRLLAVRRNSS